MNGLFVDPMNDIKIFDMHITCLLEVILSTDIDSTMTTMESLESILIKNEATKRPVPQIV